MRSGADNAPPPEHGRKPRYGAAPPPGEVEAPPHTYGGGGPHGARIYWPAGLEQLTPAERAEALQRGWWADGDMIVTRDGKRFPR